MGSYGPPTRKTIAIAVLVSSLMDQNKRDRRSQRRNIIGLMPPYLKPARPPQHEPRVRRPASTVQVCTVQ